MSTMVARDRTRGTATRRSALEWRELIEAYQCCGEHRDAFCARPRGVCELTLVVAVAPAAG